jgi:hypothetical protein
MDEQLEVIDLSTTTDPQLLRAMLGAVEDVCKRRLRVIESIRTTITEYEKEVENLIKLAGTGNWSGSNKRF